MNAIAAGGEVRHLALRGGERKLRDVMRIRWDRVLPLAAVVIFWILVFWTGARLKDFWP